MLTPAIRDAESAGLVDHERYRDAPFGTHFLAGLSKPLTHILRRLNPDAGRGTSRTLGDLLRPDVTVSSPDGLSERCREPSCQKGVRNRQDNEGGEAAYAAITEAGAIQSSTTAFTFRYKAVYCKR
jgi:hypothetical protein